MIQDTTKSPGSTQPPASLSMAEEGAIGVSCRWPLLLLFIPGAVWLVCGSVFALLASIKFHSPVFLSDQAWLGYGRLWPAYTNSLLYGFGIPTALGVILWLFAHLGRAPLVYPGVGIIGAISWNLGVMVGIYGILAGDSTGFVLLELPGYAAVFLILGYLLIGLTAAFTLHARKDRSLTPAQWFLLAGLLWYPWIHSTAELLLVTWPVRGMVQASIAWWYAQNLDFVWLWLVGLGVIYYFIPKISASELNSRNLALFSFWTLLLFSPWAGIPGSAPLPSWMPVLSSVALVLGLVTLVTIALSLFRTVAGKWSLTDSGSLKRFFTFGGLLLLLAGAMHIAGSYALAGRVLNLTWFVAAKNHLNHYGFFCMVMFGAVYYILPNLLGVEACKSRVGIHFWLSALGVLVVALPLAAAGIVEGLLLRNPNLPFLNVMNSGLRFLRLSTLGDLMVLTANVVFLLNVAGAALRVASVRVKAAYEIGSEDLFKSGEVKL